MSEVLETLKINSQKVTLDFNKNNYITIASKQYDKNSRYIIIQLANNGQPVVLDQKFYANIKMLTPDNRAILDEIPIQEDGTLLLELTESMLYCPGKAEAEIRVYEGFYNEKKETDDVRLISTMSFYVLINASPYSDDRVIDSDEFNALTKLYAKALKDYTYVMEEAEKSANAAKESEINAAESATAAQNSATVASDMAALATDKASEASTSAANASQSEVNAKASEENAKASEEVAIEKANIASTKAEEALNSATSANNSANTATIKAEEALESATNAANSETNAKLSEDNAKSSEEIAIEKATIASTKADEALASATNAANSADIASVKADEALQSATIASDSETIAVTKAEEAKVSEENAKTYMDTAIQKAEEAKESETIAVTKATEALESADNAATSATNAANSAQEVLDMANMSKSYAVGTNGEIREGDNTDNALYYYEQSKRIAQGVSGVMYMGTVTFADLSNPDNQKPNYMFNISEAFTTDATFKEGAGHTYGAGVNVCRTADGFWDALVGSTVTGIKGNAEVTFRTGNVNITAKDIGIPNPEVVSDSEPSDQEAGAFWMKAY